MKQLDIFIIHLDRIEPLFSRLKTQLDEFGLSYNVFSAFDGEKIKNPGMRTLRRIDNPMYKQFEYKRAYSPGSLSCTLSHLAIMKYAKMMKLKSFIVLEEDAILSKNFVQRLEELKYVPENADILYLGGIYHKDKKPSLKEQECKTIYDAKLMELYGLHGYVMYEKGYDTIINIVESHEDYIDSTIMYNIRKTNKIRGYAMVPFCVYQDNDFSNTLNKITKNRHLTKSLYNDNNEPVRALF